MSSHRSGLNGRPSLPKSLFWNKMETVRAKLISPAATGRYFFYEPSSASTPLDRKNGHVAMSRPQTHLQRKLNLAFSLFFLFPTAGFIFFCVKYGLLSDEIVPYFFLGLLIFSFIGFNILKNLFARIATISETVRRAARHRRLLSVHQGAVQQHVPKTGKEDVGDLGAQGPLRTLLCDLRPGRDPAHRPRSRAAA
jgi:hypothetical protein